MTDVGNTEEVLTEVAVTLDLSALSTVLMTITNHEKRLRGLEAILKLRETSASGAESRAASSIASVHWETSLAARGYHRDARVQHKGVTWVSVTHDNKSIPGDNPDWLSA